MAAEEFLFLVRHGVAEDEHPAGDAARALTEKGRRRFRKHSKKVVAQFEVRGIVSSPLVRAVQTAELLAGRAGLDAVAIHVALVPGPEAARKLVALAQKAEPGTAFVGHEPSLSEAAASLLTLKEGLPFDFKKGGVLVLRRTKEGWEFVAFRAPRREEVRRLEGATGR